MYSRKVKGQIDKHIAFMVGEHILSPMTVEMLLWVASFYGELCAGLYWPLKESGLPRLFHIPGSLLFMACLKGREHTGLICKVILVTHPPQIPLSTMKISIGIFFSSMDSPKILPIYTPPSVLITTGLPSECSMCDGKATHYDTVHEKAELISSFSRSNGYSHSRSNFLQQSVGEQADNKTTGI